MKNTAEKITAEQKDLSTEEKKLLDRMRARTKKVAAHFPGLMLIW